MSGMFFQDMVIDADDVPYSTSYGFTEEEKAKFARALLKHKPGDELEAAISVFGSDKSIMGKCLYAAAHWTRDVEVVRLQQEIISREGIGIFLATKEEAARRVWEMTEDKKRFTGKEQIEAMKLYCEIMKYTAKESTNVQVNIVNKVMEVPVAGSDEEWERAAATSQAKLIEDTMAVATKH